MTRKKKGTRHYLQLKRDFLGIPNETIKSEKLNSLSIHTRWLYIVILTKFNRDNNKIKDNIIFTYKDLEDITGFNDRRVSCGIKELEEAGFLAVTHGWKHCPSKYQPILEWLV